MQFEMVEIKKVKLDKKTRIGFILVFIMLAINSLNIIIGKFIQILITEEIFWQHKATSDIFVWYS
jgi:hypothetical protein